MAKKKRTESTTFIVSCLQGFLEDFDDQVLKIIRQETGLKTTRSGLIKILMEMLLENAEQLQLNDVEDEQSLKAALAAFFKGINSPS